MEAPPPPPPPPAKPPQEEVGGESSMDEDEVRVVSRPRRIADREPSDVEDEDEESEEDEDEDEVDGGLEVEEDEESEESGDDARGRTSRHSRPAPRASRGPAGDPTIIPWAREIGVDPQKMHVMQTSLFRMPEEEKALKALNQPQSRKRLLLTSNLSRKHSRDSEGEGQRADSRQVRGAVCLCTAGWLKWRGYTARVVRARLGTRTIPPLAQVLSCGKLRICLRGARTRLHRRRARVWPLIPRRMGPWRDARASWRIVRANRDLVSM